MNQSKALLMSEKMAEALEKAGNDKLTNGIFVCLDAEQGLYRFVPLADIKLAKDSLGDTINKMRKEYCDLSAKLDSFLNPSMIRKLAVLNTEGHIIKIVPFQLALLADNEPIPEDIANGYYKVVDNHLVIDEPLKEAFHSLD